MIKSGRHVGKVGGGGINKVGFNPGRVGAKNSNPSFARAHRGRKMGWIARAKDGRYPAPQPDILREIASVTD